MANEKRLTLSTDETCGDCIHAKVCKEINGSWFSPKNIAFCRFFKNKADLMEVVRCKECKHSSGTRIEPNTCVCFKHGMIMFADHFCAWGERIDNG